MGLGLYESHIIWVPGKIKEYYNMSPFPGMISSY